MISKNLILIIHNFINFLNDLILLINKKITAYTALNKLNKMNLQAQGFKFYNANSNNESITKRRKLSIGSEGSDSTGEKLNESFNRLTLSSGNP